MDDLQEAKNNNMAIIMDSDCLFMEDNMSEINKTIGFRFKNRELTKFWLLILCS